MKREGETRISSGCAISGIFCRDGRLITGDTIKKSIAVMHNRSNGLGGGFAGYGIYPQYKDYYAIRILFDSQGAREETERFLDKRFDIINLSKIPVRHKPEVSLMRSKADDNSSDNINGDFADLRHSYIIIIYMPENFKLENLQYYFLLTTEKCEP